MAPKTPGRSAATSWATVTVRGEEDLSNSARRARCMQEAELWCPVIGGRAVLPRTGSPGSAGEFPAAPAAIKETRSQEWGTRYFFGSVPKARSARKSPGPGERSFLLSLEVC